MKVLISYPPIVNSLGQKAMVSQNRNVQYFSVPTYLLGITHAQAATMLKENNIEVIWDDGNAQLKTFEKWFEDLINHKPDLVVFETTTPIMKFMWEVTKKAKQKLKKLFNSNDWLSFYEKPEETLLNSDTDIVIFK